MTSESPTSDLRVSIEQPAAWSRRLSITVPRERVQRVRNRVAAQIAGNVRLPGFRKGHTPSSFIEKRFAADIQQETVDRLIQETYKEALDRENLQPIAQGKVERIEYEPGADFTYEVELEVQPSITLDRVEGFVVGRPADEVGEGEVEEVIRRLRAARGHTHPLEAGHKPETGDEVVVEITDLDAPPAEDESPEDADARVYRFALGEGQAIPAIEDAILTLEPGGEDEFTVRFPEDFPDAAQAGQEQRLRIRLVEGSRKHLPEVDDAFAQAVGEFADLEALRARVRTDLEEEKKRGVEEQVRGALIQQIVDTNPFDVPPSMVDRWLDYMTGDVPGEDGKRRPRTPEQEEQISQFREVLRSQAEGAVRRMLIVESLADREGLRPSAEDVDARVEALAQQHGRSPSDVWLELERSGQMQALESEITEQKVFAYLHEKNTVA